MIKIFKNINNYYNKKNLEIKWDVVQAEQKIIY